MQKRVSVEELALLIQKMKTDLEHAKLYQQKLERDKVKLRHTLNYNIHNYEYIKNHCGVVALDYVKSIAAQITRLKGFLKHAEEDVKKFENNIKQQVKNIEQKEEELKIAKERAANKVVQFRRKKNG